MAFSRSHRFFFFRRERLNLESPPAAASTSTKDQANDSIIQTNAELSSAYPISYPLSPVKSVFEQVDPEKLTSKKMVLKCKSCRNYFDSTFSVEEFSQLPRDQNQAGTLHLCPHCGNLSIYELVDYKEPGDEQQTI